MYNINEVFKLEEMNMAKSYREFGFDDDIELMNLTYQMNTGNFIDYTNYENEDIFDKENINKEQPKIGL